MKTYIWNTEYQVYAVNAEDQEKAKSKLVCQFCLDCINELIDDKDKPTPQYNLLPSYVLARAQGLFSNDVPMMLGLIQRDADIIIPEGEAVIFDHSNE